MGIINKVTNLVGAAIGVVETVIPIIKEALVVVARISGTIFFWTDFDEKVIEVLNDWFNRIQEGFETFKNIWLSIGR